MTLSSYVFVLDSVHGWLPGKVVSIDEEKACCDVIVTGSIGAGDFDEKDTKETRTVKLSEYSNRVLPLQNLDENGDKLIVEDVCDLPSLHEASILYNLKERYEGSDNSDHRCSPYTRVGEIIIAVNPFQWHHSLYSKEVQKLYCQTSYGDEAISLPPHIYEASSSAFRGLRSASVISGVLSDQSILVSGESGAGKTESVKIIMNHLASMSVLEGYCDHGQDQNNPVIQRVLDSNPLLEAFGNAKTTRNDNSSRFGKYTQLQFLRKDSNANEKNIACELVGSICETYLLEKSRVVSHDVNNERNYHIFYQLLAAPVDVKKAFWQKLDSTSCFKFLGHHQPSVINSDSDSLFRIEGKSDEDKWVQTVKSLALVGVCDQLLTTLMQAVCIVLQFGNICFAQNDDDVSFISSTDELAKLAEITGIDENHITKALLTRTVVAGGQEEVFVVPLNASDAKDACDAFAKEIYHIIFHWLVRKINEATSADSTSIETEHSQPVESQLGTIGLLDIFGFESFQVNRFEQLCINYTNEKLQQKYICDVFQSVIQEYEFEGLPLFRNIVVSNNSEVLSLIEGRMGILDVLNEECLRPKGSNEAFVSKLKTINSDATCLIQDRLHRSCEFAVMHYAGPVKYDATMFLTKNVDSLPIDLLKCGVEFCSNSIIKTELKALLDTRIAAATSSSSRSARAVTIVSKFKSQLNVLMARIGKTRTRYIRCIKPNPECTPRKMNLKMTLDQLRCAGIVAAVSVTRLAFPNRLLHETALSRFRLLMGEDVAPKSTTVEYVESAFSKLLKTMEVIDNGVVTKAFVCGKTRLYFRKGALELLEKQRLAVIGSLAILLQRHIRVYLSKSWYWLCLDVVVAVQSMFRCKSSTKSFLKKRRATTAIVRWLRFCVARTLLLDLRYNHATLLVQTMLRMKWVNIKYLRCKMAVICIQRTARGALCRPVYKQMVLDAQNEVVVNERIAMLQKRLADAEMKWLQAEKQRIEAEKRFSTEGVQAINHGSEEKEGHTSLNKALINESGEILEYLRNSSKNLKSKNYALEKELVSLKRRNQKLLDQNKSLHESLHSQRQQIVSLKNSNKSLGEGIKRQKNANSSLVKKINSDKLEQQSKLARLQEDHQKKVLSLTSEITMLKDARDAQAKLKASSTFVKPHSTTYSTMTSLNAFRFTFSEGKGEWEPYDTGVLDETLPYDLSMSSSGFVTGAKAVPKINTRVAKSKLVLPGHHNMKTESALSSSPDKHWRRYHLSRNNTLSSKVGQNHSRDVKEDVSQTPVLRHSPSSLALAVESLNRQERRSNSREERRLQSTKSSKSSLSKALESSRRLS